MRILAIETATAVCAAAVIEDGSVRKEVTLVEKHVHSEKLLSLIDAVLDRERYDAIAVSIGPGSFTGLRIGLSVAKGMAFAGGLPILAVPTLEALAEFAVEKKAVRPNEDVVAMIDARRNDVYAAAYRVTEGKCSLVWGPEALSVDDVFGRISPSGRTVVMGDGVDKFLGRKSKSAGDLVVPPPSDRQCSAASVGIVGFRMAQRGEFADLVSLEPLYVRDFVSLVRTQHSSP